MPPQLVQCRCLIPSCLSVSPIKTRLIAFPENNFKYQVGDVDVVKTSARLIFVIRPLTPRGVLMVGKLRLHNFIKEPLQHTR